MTDSKAPSETTNAAVGVSLAFLLAAFVVFMQAGQYQSLGPVDLETADHLALALWVAAPTAGGLAAVRGSNGAVGRGALRLGLIVGVAAALFALGAIGTGDYTCSINLPSFPGAYPLGCLAVGALAGEGMGVGLLLSGLAARRRITLLPGVLLAVAATLVTSIGAGALFYDAVRCLR